MNVIKIKNICKKYKNGTVANKDICLEIERGRVVGLIGPNGAGKTTLVRQIVGLSKPTSGTIEIFDKANNRITANNQFISYFNQKIVLLEALTAYEVIYFTGIYRGLSKSDAKDQCAFLIDYFSLDSIINKKLIHLSGGQSKIIMLAAAFIGKYEIIVFDEPTNDLDPENRLKLWNLIKTYKEKYETTFIVSSHNLEELEGVVDDVAIIMDSKLIDFDNLLMLKKKYSDNLYFCIKGGDEILSNIDEYMKVKSDFNLIKSGDGELVYKFNQNHESTDSIHKLTDICVYHDLEFNVYKSKLSDIYFTLGGIQYE